MKANLAGTGLLPRLETTPWSRDALAAAGIDLAELRERIPPDHRLSGYAKSANGPFSFALVTDARGAVVAVAHSWRDIPAALDRLLGHPETLEGALAASLDRLGVRR